MSAAKDTFKVADSYNKLYGDLPAETRVSLSVVRSGPAADVSKTNAVKDFVRSQVPASDRKELDEVFKHTIPLHGQKRGKIKKPQPEPRGRKVKYLTARERRKLGLNRVPKTGLKHSDFVELHELWKKYACDVLNLRASSDDQLETPRDGELRCVLDEQLQMRICRADYHGALVKVTKSKVASNVGVQGFVVMETRNTFQIITRDDQLKMIPKAGSAFSFCVDDFLFTVAGNNLCGKPSERAVKKWRNKPPMFDFM